MSAPRIETLLVSLVVLIAAGIALAAAYAPPLPRQPQTRVVQETPPEEAEASIASPAPQRNDDRSAASDAASSVIDAAVQQIAGMNAEVRIALLVMSGAASTAIVAVRRRRRAVAGEASLRGRPILDRVCGNGMADDLRHGGAPPRGRPHRYSFFRHVFLLSRPLQASGCATSPFFPPIPRTRMAKGGVGEGRRGEEGTQASECGTRLSHPTNSTPESCERTDIAAEDRRSAPARNWGATVRRWSKGARKRAQVWTGTLHRIATLPGIYRRVQHWKHMCSQTRKWETSEETSVSGCDEHPSLLHSSPSVNTDEGQSIDQAADEHRLAASQQSRAQSELDAAEYPVLTTDGAAAAVATVLDVYERHGLTQSEVMFAEARVERQRAQVRLIVAAHPDDARALEDLPDQIQTTIPGSQAQWQRTAQAQPALMITVHGRVPAMRGGHLLLPVARRLPVVQLPAINRSAPAVSFLPLRAWRHIGFYGGKAVDSASAALIDLLYAEAPDALAVTILDHGQISSLCQGAPHLVPMPGAAADALNALGRSARSALPSDTTVRPVLIVIVEPDATLLNVYGDLTTRLLRRPDAPVYTMLVQTRAPEVTQRLPPSLPAVITSGGSGRLPGAGDAPSPGKVRILTPHLRLERHCHVYDAARLAALSGVLRAGSVQSLRPTVWDIAGAS